MAYCAMYSSFSNYIFFVSTSSCAKVDSFASLNKWLGRLPHHLLMLSLKVSEDHTHYTSLNKNKEGSCWYHRVYKSVAGWCIQACFPFRQEPTTNDSSSHGVMPNGPIVAQLHFLQGQVTSPAFLSFTVARSVVS